MHQPQLISPASLSSIVFFISLFSFSYFSLCGLPGRQGPHVIYWSSTGPSIKRCTCVNKRKNSGSRWMLENNKYRCPGGWSQLETGCWSENHLQTEGIGPLVTPGWATRAKMWKKCCYGRGRTWVDIAVRPCLHSFLTHNKHHPFENKVWEIYIFIKKCIHSLLKSSL